MTCGHNFRQTNVMLHCGYMLGGEVEEPTTCHYNVTIAHPGCCLGSHFDIPNATGTVTSRTTEHDYEQDTDVTGWNVVGIRVGTMLAETFGCILVIYLTVGAWRAWWRHKRRRGAGETLQPSGARGEDVDRSRHPAWCAVKLEQLSDLRDLAKAELGQDYPAATMYDVNRRILQPMCDEHRKSYAQIVNGSDPKFVQIFVSHAWAENFDEFVTAVNAPFAHWRVKPTLWICALALIQSTDPDIVALQVGTGDDPSQAPFTLALKEADQILVVRNQAMDLYERIWCCWELFVAYELNLVHKPGGLIVTGQPYAAGVATLVDITSAQASNAEDKRRILDHILSTNHQYDSVNELLTEVKNFMATH